MDSSCNACIARSSCVGQHLGISSCLQQEQSLNQSMELAAYFVIICESLFVVVMASTGHAVGMQHSTDTALNGLWCSARTRYIDQTIYTWGDVYIPRFGCFTVCVIVASRNHRDATTSWSIASLVLVVVATSHHHHLWRRRTRSVYYARGSCLLLRRRRDNKQTSP